ncbi:MAG: hypothetical protein CMH30_09540 [Micavibrio sp.]|nr:hypothetical protein [Micavibrio sp.]|tara:strand:- start:1292 stop:2395 length:1104 start_codon:yes stop_codon:yes gene_type:complete
MSDINIVCFDPSYLFSDLVKRFEGRGCVFSEFPLASAKTYVWMRPQEYVAYLDFIEGIEPEDVTSKFVSAINKIENQITLDKLKKRSVVIHHGICPDPIYQFDAYNSTIKLSDVARVVGVCPFDDCYRQMSNIGNKNNFSFCPIGYDHEVFSEEYIKDKKNSDKENVLNIGFVGRAYGTTDESLLNSSIKASPKGYIKGGDHLLNLSLRLKALDVKFKIHILGQNWEEQVKLFDTYGIDCHYYQRDKDIKYTDYPKIYAGFDLLIVTSRGESGPVPVLEALSLGVPVVGCENAGMVKYVATITSGCHTYKYDTKWHIAEIEKLTEHILRLRQKPLALRDKLMLRKDIEQYTTINWINTIMKYSEGLT